VEVFEESAKAVDAGEQGGRKALGAWSWLPPRRGVFRGGGLIAEEDEVEDAAQAGDLRRGFAVALTGALDCG
jgi:hypothetical protein